MRPVTRIFAAFLILLGLCLTTTSGLPGGGGGEPKKAGPPPVPNDNATWACTHKYKVMYSHYKLQGTGWNKTEKQIKKAISDAGMVTRWKYEENNGTDGVVSFKSSFNLPLGCAGSLSKHASMLLGINRLFPHPKTGAKQTGVVCPQICKKC